MEGTLLYSSLSIFFLIFVLKFLLQTKIRHKNLPPSPFALPILGHLHLLKDPLHRTLHTLSQKYGPIFSLYFGTHLVLVVSSPSAVEDCFNKNDIIFANRPRLIMGKYYGYNHSILALAPYGDHWRNLRRLCALEIFSTNRLNLFIGIRREEIKMLLSKLYRISGNDFAKVQLKPMFQELTFNVIMRMVAGKRYYGEDTTGLEEARQFRDLIREAFELSKASYPGDFLPILKWVDYNGYLKRVMRLSRKTDLFLQGLIDEQRSNKGDLESTNSLINHLLALQESQPEYYTDEIIKGLILTMLTTGTDTSVITLEWGMSNLLNHPSILKKAKVELDTQLGLAQLIEEPDLFKLHYLQNIISETLRLYPAGPLLVPHMSSNDCIVGGYDIPRDTMLLVNAWAIHRDPKLWDDPTSFKPERFDSEEGETHKMMPFGLGRRACPGVGLANRVVGLALGSLIQCFEWQRVDEKEIDMAEGSGITMPKAEPLEAMCKARHIMSMVLPEAVKNC